MSIITDSISDQQWSHNAPLSVASVNHHQEHWDDFEDSRYTIGHNHILVVVAYNKFEMPDEAEIEKSVRHYVKQDWYLSDRSESTFPFMFGSYTLLEFWRID